MEFMLKFLDSLADKFYTELNSPTLYKEIFIHRGRYVLIVA